MRRTLDLERGSGLRVLGQNYKGDPNSRVPQIDEIVLAVQVVDVAIIVVRPACRPRLGDFEVVATVSEVRSAAYHLDVMDGEMVIAAEVLFEMGIVDAAGLILMRRLGMLVLPGIIVVLVLLLMGIVVMFILWARVILVLVLPVMVVLGHGGHGCPCQKCQADTADN